MSGITLNLGSLSRGLEASNRQLDNACRSYGLTAVMFRTAKFVFYMMTLATTVFLIQQGVEPTLAMGFSVLLISGPEALETWLIRQGNLSEPAQEETDDSR